MTKHKVFGIGFHKTGTTSLGRALELLGYSVCGPVGVMEPDIADKVHKLAFGYTDQYDAFQDNPWPLLFRDLDARYPGSKFILTVRPMQRWIESMSRHFGAEDTPMRQWIYGVGHPVGHEDLYVERHQRHVEQVKQYFKDRPDDLLVMQLTSGEGWKTLCSFLGKPIPGDDFPNVNKQTDRANSVIYLTRHIRRAVKRVLRWRQRV